MFVGFIPARPGVRRVNSGAPLGRRLRLVSFGCAVAVVGIIWVVLVQSGAPWGSSGSLLVGAYIRALLGGHRDHSGSLGSFGRSLGFTGFIWARPCGRLVNLVLLGSRGRSLGVVGFILVRCVHSGALWVSSG